MADSPFECNHVVTNTNTNSSLNIDTNKPKPYDVFDSQGHNTNTELRDPGFDDNLHAPARMYARPYNDVDVGGIPDMAQ